MVNGILEYLGITMEVSIQRLGATRIADRLEQKRQTSDNIKD